MSKVQKHGSSRATPFRGLCAYGHFSLKTSSGQSRRSRTRQRRPWDLGSNGFDKAGNRSSLLAGAWCIFTSAHTVSRGLKTSQVLRKMLAGSRMDLTASFLGTAVSGLDDAIVLMLLRRRTEGGGDVSDIQLDQGTKYTSTLCSVSGRSLACKQCKCPEGRRGTSCWSLCPVARAARSSRDSRDSRWDADPPKASSKLGRRILSDLPDGIDLREASCLDGRSSSFSLPEKGEGSRFIETHGPKSGPKSGRSGS